MMFYIWATAMTRVGERDAIQFIHILLLLLLLLLLQMVLMPRIMNKLVGLYSQAHSVHRNTYILFYKGFTGKQLRHSNEISVRIPFTVLS